MFSQDYNFGELLTKFERAGGEVVVEDRRGWFRKYTMWTFKFKDRSLDPIKGSDLVYPSINRIVSRWIIDCINEDKNV